MTTIAYRDGVLAVDSAVSAGGFFEPNTTTKLIVGPCVMAAHGGWLSYCVELQEWAETGTPTKPLPSPMPPDSETIFVFSGGTVWWATRAAKDDEPQQRMYPHRPVADFYAVGSGAHFAYGAMAAGAGAVEAARVACGHDCYSREPILSHQVDQLVTKVADVNRARHNLARLKENPE